MSDYATDAYPGYANPNCIHCRGEGMVVRQRQITAMGHGCDGTLEDCERTCPVPIPELEQYQDYCECISEFPYEASPEDKGE